jgi:hypothetical protein
MADAHSLATNARRCSRCAHRCRSSSLRELRLLFVSFDLSRVSRPLVLELVPTLAAIISAEPLLCSRWQGWLEVVATVGTAHGALLQF